MSFEHCMRCTICMENCPVMRVDPRFPGPKQAGPDAQRFRLDGEKSVDQWVKYCNQCRRCQVACPYGVEVAEIILRAQLKYGKEHFSPLSSHIFANAYHFAKLCSLLAPLYNRTRALPVVKKALWLMGVSDVPDLPEVRFLTLERGRKRKGRGRKVVFFHGCHLAFNRPDIGRKARDLLVMSGCRVVMPRQQCCGLPALGNGDIDMASRFARKNAAMLTRYIDKGFDVVYACPSCGLTLTRDYPGILGVQGGRKIAENTYNVLEYSLPLVKELLESSREAALGRFEGDIAYHVPCHLRALGIGYPALGFFEMIDGLAFTVLDNDCCGLSGTYGLKRRNREASVLLGTAAAQAVRDTGADMVVSDCGACRIQLGHHAAMQALDPVEIVHGAASGGPLGRGLRSSLARTITGFLSRKGGPT
jgi:glycerol-3-phosphate dehydrogenase subunit C